MSFDNNMKLELVQTLFRHGARTCIKNETKSMTSYVDQTLQDIYGEGQLTTYGKTQMYKLGCALRSRYDDFLESSYHPKEVCARSTDKDRTKMSLQLVLAGLYPPTDEQNIHSGFNLLPVPIDTVPINMDCLLLMYFQPRYRKAFTKFMVEQSEKIEEIPEVLKIRQFLKDKDAELLKKLTLKTAYSFYNALEILKTEKCKLPEWHCDDIHDSLLVLAIKLLDEMSGTLQLNKILNGPLIRKLIENMNLKNEMTNPRKIYLYSTHDYTIGGFLRAHNVQNAMRFPCFGCAIILEKLRDPEGQLFVRMLAWTGKDDDFFTVKLGKYEDICTIEEYLKMVEDIVPSDEELDKTYQECIVDLKKFI